MKTFKLISLLALVFLAGVVFGVVATRVVVRRIVQQAILHPERIQMVIEHRLTRELRLDNDQQIKLHVILADTHTQLGDLRAQYLPQIGLVLSNADGQFSAILTPEQQVKYETFKDKNRPFIQALKEGRNP